MSGSAELAAIARSVATGAGRLARAADQERPQRSELVGRSTRKSSSTDLVTATDTASERFIVEQLRALRPDDAIVGEEGGGNTGTSGLTWLVDPIDGTTNFVYAYPAWTVSVAVADVDGPVAGAVYEPMRDECFVAARGEGASLNGRALGPLVPPTLEEALVATGFAYGSDLRGKQARLLPLLLREVRDIRRGGAASLDCCYVAAGRVDAFYEAALKPWDTAAGELVANEAGARSKVVEGLVDAEATLVVAPEPLLSALVELLNEAAQIASVP
jgi:myo-inositol-1(or 4)-monophosphatase